ncbi:MAG TPA: DUF1501 domain-containing protein [Rhodanobacteraceae bacterium]|nr:DUF1501 domain-containing protein [Rhodanobacteraceae bacterium]
MDAVRTTMNRRQFLGGALVATAALTLWPKLTFAATGSDTRFLLVMLRGGLDGLEAVPPYGDPGYAAIRGALALSPQGSAQPNGKPAHKLDNVFALHPSLDYASQLYAQGQFMPLVAAAPPYWGRSHFDAQDCLENGTAEPHGAQTGWLNRCVAAMPGVEGLAVATVMPLTMRGPGKVSSWSPPLPTQVNPILLQRLQPLYAADARLAEAFSRAVDQQQEAPMQARAPMDASGKPGKANLGQLPVLMGAAGGFMAKANGPRVGFVEDNGWDTHANEAAILTRKLAELDAGIKAYREAMGDTWNHTVVAIVTEFGRTAAINGTGGTDHGTGGAMFLAGGALRGGRVAGQWPGIARGELYQDRDLHATTDLRAVFKGVLASHLGVSESALETAVFPGSAKARPVENLLSDARARA